MTSIHINELEKHYGAFPVLKGITISIQDGEFISFLGPSGCGKSTLLFCIAGLEDISGGSIRFGDRNITTLSPRARNVALVFQDYALYPHLTVHDNIAFPLKQQGLARELVGKQVAWAAGLLGLSDLLHRLPADLSGGQRQRVAVGRAIVRNPSVLLMDEPLSNLDASLRVRMRTEIRQLQRELKMTVIFVTHDQEEAMVLSDRIAVMRDGLIQQFATPNEIYSRPSNQFVAGFIGSPQMNFLEPGLLGLSGQQNMLYGIRPHDLSLTAQSADDIALTGTLSLIESGGHIQFLHVEIGGQSVKATCADASGLSPGQELHLHAPRQTLHRFAADDGVRLSQ